MFRTSSILAIALAMTTGCNDTGNGNNNNNIMQTQPDLAVGPDLAQFDPGPYPASPYGVKVGNTLHRIQGRGFMLSKDLTDASTLTLGTVAVDTIRNRQECTCLMLSQSATWCGPCNAEQQDLIDAVTADPSFCVFNVLVDGPTPGKAPTDGDILDWNQRHSQNFPIIGANIATRAFLPTPDYLPTNVTIRPSTMKILDINYGLGPTTIDDAKALCAGN